MGTPVCTFLSAKFVCVTQMSARALTTCYQPARVQKTKYILAYIFQDP